MPAAAHALVAFAYLAASVAAGWLLAGPMAFGASLGAVAGMAVALLAVAAHLASAFVGLKARSDAEAVRLRAEVRQAHERLERTEARADALEEAMAREISERRRTLVKEMKGLEELIAGLGKSFDIKLRDNRQVGVSQTTNTDAEALVAVREALRENRVDLHLQPIVNLPQRRVCFYEGFTRLRDAQGNLIMPGTFLKAAAGAGLLGVIDNLLLFRCVQIVRRLSERDRRIGVFCNIAIGSLADEAFFPDFLTFMRENRELAGSLIFEIGVKDFETRTPVAARNMARLVDLGFRFSLDKGDTLAVDLPEFQRAGIRFLKVEGRRLLTDLSVGGARPTSAISREISPQDVPSVFARYGVDLIVDKVEEERTVVEVLEFDIPYGQGHVFGQPRPIKGSLLEDSPPPSDFLRRAGGPG
jgi:cyclic-di-GMP phosphodiesterase TipF (flagellum assembly factor)